MEAVGKLAGGVAHDFNNLLTVINGYSEIVLRSLRAGDPLRDHIEQIKKSGERAAGLTRQLLALSRKQMLVAVVLDLNTLLVEMEKILGRLIGEDVALSVRRDPQLWKTKVDAGQVEQIIMNIAVNARDAMPRGGKFAIETANAVLTESQTAGIPDARPGEYVLMALTDSGCGMDYATKQHIFEPFFTTKGPDQGTGLGLATVYGIVKQSGGHVDVYSEIGIGTTFKVYFPRMMETGCSHRVELDAKAPLRGTETVLLVEDEEGVRTLLRLVLQRLGYNVLDARHGGEALLICERYKDLIHIMVTDVIMPQMSGRELSERLRPLRPEMKVLFMSGYTDDAVVRHGMLDARTPFLQKPISPDALAQKVREVLA